MFRGGAVFGPGVEGGARQATPAELEQMRIEAEGSRFDGGTPRPPDLDPAVTATAGDQLIELGRTTLHWEGHDLSAHIVTFWHGDSLLEITVRAPDGRSSSSSTRVPRRLARSHLPMITAYLTDALQVDG